MEESLRPEPILSPVRCLKFQRSFFCVLFLKTILLAGEQPGQDPSETEPVWGSLVPDVARIAFSRIFR